MRNARRLAIALSFALTACVAPGVGMPADLDTVPNRLVPVGHVSLGADGRQLTVDFIGGREFDPSDPCSAAYRGSARIAGDELEIEIHGGIDFTVLPSGMACDLVGYARHLSLRLDQPFPGNLVHDLSGQLLFLRAPKGLAEITGLPEGWELRREETIGGSLTPRWERIWSPQSDPWPADGSSMVTLIQAFGGPVDAIGGLPTVPVTVNGQPASLALWKPSGDMTLVWSLGSDEVALDGYQADFSRDQFVALAESVTLPAS